MNALFIVTILFFVIMPVLAAATCCYLYNKDDAGSQIGVKTQRTPLV